MHSISNTVENAEGEVLRHAVRQGCSWKVGHARSMLDSCLCGKKFERNQPRKMLEPADVFFCAFSGFCFGDRFGGPLE